MSELVLSAQVSVYPLRQAKLRPAIDALREALVGAGLDPKVGSMSTVVVGEAGAIFAALEHGMREMAAVGDVVMNVAFSNACPT